MVRETKRNGTKKILDIKKRNETKRYHLGNETKRNDKKITFSNPCFILNLAKHVHAKFQLSSFYPDGLRQIIDQF
jgi:hypothetical protein